jgi:hypothetical protein
MHLHLGVSVHHPQDRRDNHYGKHIQGKIGHVVMLIPLLSVAVDVLAKVRDVAGVARLGD